MLADRVQKKKKKKDKRKKKDRERKNDRRNSTFIEQEIKQIREYRVRKRIGKGGFGSVYMVTSTKTGKTHAIKRISLKGTPKSELESIEMEIQLLKYLKHPNIVTYIDVIPEPEDGYLNIVLELCEQGSLASILKDFGSFPEPLTCRYVSQVLLGLDFLHQQGVIHRDIKGANILADKEGNVKLADFGVATKLKSNDPDNQLPAGTTYWMAPEIVKMTGQLSYACDIWSLGSTILELLTGQPPYFDLPMMSACFRIVQDDHPPLPPNISENCKAFLMSCFQKDPQRRPNASVLLKHEWLQGQTDAKSGEDLTRRLSQENSKLSPANSERKANSFNTAQSTDSDTNTMDSKTDKRDSINDKKIRTLSPRRPIPLQNNWASEKPSEDGQTENGFPDLDLTAFEDGDDGGEGGLQKYQEDDDEFGDFGDMELNEGPEGGDGEEDFGELVLDDPQVLELKFEDDDEDTPAMDKNSLLVTSLQDAFQDLTLENTEKMIPEKKVLKALEKLSLLVAENEGVIAGLVNNMTLGMISIVDMLTSDNDKIIQACIKFVNDLLYDERGAQGPRGTKFQQSICTIGIISLIVKYSSPRYTIRIRTHASNFVRHLCYSNDYTRKMFIACGGLPVLIRFLYEDYSNERARQLVLSSIDCIWNIFEIKSNPKNDFCRLFCKFGLLSRLAKVFYILKKDTKHSDVQDYVDRIVKIFSLFSGGDKLVRQRIAEVNVLKYIIPVLSSLGFDNLLTFMKTFHRVCGVKLPKPMKEMEDAGIIPVFVKLLDHPKKEIHQQVILCMEMITDIAKSRKEKAVLAGIIPHLLKVIDERSQLKQVALRILCDLPISVPAVRVELNKHRMVEFYVSTLSDSCWRPDALNALKLWLTAEPTKVSYKLTTSFSIPRLVAVCTSQKVFRQHLALILPTMKLMFAKSIALTRALASSPRFLDSLLRRLREDIQDDPETMTIHQASVEMMNEICSKHTNLSAFNERYGILDAVRTMCERARAAEKNYLWMLARICLTNIKGQLEIA